MCNAAVVPLVLPLFSPEFPASPRSAPLPARLLMLLNQWVNYYIRWFSWWLGERPTMLSLSRHWKEKKTAAAAAAAAAIYVQKGAEQKKNCWEKWTKSCTFVRSLCVLRMTFRVHFSPLKVARLLSQSDSQCRRKKTNAICSRKRASRIRKYG